MKRNGGFTLIELLVVISIVSFIATISYGYLNQARSDGRDASAQSDLLSLRPEMELLYVENGSTSYSGLCSNARIVKFDASIASKVGTNMTCDVSDTQWAVEILLLSGNYFCIDSLGASLESADSKETEVGADAVQCR